MNDRISVATDLMLRFGDRTGLTSHRPSRRYLWTDAFAVCNFLGLARITKDRSYEGLALRLVDRVHEELGRYRSDDRRRGWLNGLSDAEAREHPTRGGLRIGKPLPERAPNEPFDPDLEWDRDGQYFHYLTKWMHALDQVARATGDARFNLWARELAEASHRAFVVGPPGARRMVWKLSADLSRPLVPSMGQHDPLDGYVACKKLEATGAALGSGAGPGLAAAEADFRRMIDRERLATTDPLGIGGLLTDACTLGQVDPRDELLPWILDAAARGLRRYLSESSLLGSAHGRLAFRELGLAIGLAGAPATRALHEEIGQFWLRPENRESPTWSEHLDINEVMLATSLAPEGFLIERARIGDPRDPA
ncbi:MAG TPA: hypothetical protein VF765_24520 [Polyangiaceae bacterium]